MICYGAGQLADFRVADPFHLGFLAVVEKVAKILELVLRFPKSNETMIIIL